MKPIRTLFAIFFSLSLSLPAIAWPMFGQQVAYLGGTAPQVKAGELGSFDTTQPNDLVYVSGNNKIAIPYDKLISIEYRRDVAIHLGVAPAIAVGLLKKRERKHVFSIAYTNSEGVHQAAIFEVSKEMPDTLFTIFRAKSPLICIMIREETGRHCSKTLQ